MTRLLVVLEFDDGDPLDAYDVVDRVLDAGTFQDAIAEYAEDAGRPVAVTSAVVSFAPDEPEPSHDGGCGAFIGAVLHDAALEAKERGGGDRE